MLGLKTKRGKVKKGTLKIRVNKGDDMLSIIESTLDRIEDINEAMLDRFDKWNFPTLVVGGLYMLAAIIFIGIGMATGYYISFLTKVYVMCLSLGISLLIGIWRGWSCFAALFWLSSALIFLDWIEHISL